MYDDQWIFIYIEMKVIDNFVLWHHNDICFNVFSWIYIMYSEWPATAAGNFLELEYVSMRLSLWNVLEMRFNQLNTTGGCTYGYSCSRDSVLQYVGQYTSLVNA